MTKRFLDEPFERNPVLQYAGVNYLLAEEFGKPIRVLAVWSKKLEASASGMTSCWQRAWASTRVARRR